MTLSLANILAEGLLLSLLLSLVVLGSIRFNPRLWLQDAPPQIKALVAPMTPTEKRQQKLVAAFILGLPVLILWLSITRLHAQSVSNPSFITVFLDAFGVLMVFNLFDLLVLDYLLLTIIKPKFAIIPGTEAVHQQYLYSYRFHFVGFLKGCVGLTLFSGVVALLVTVL
jgi:hypothetical protein